MHSDITGLRGRAEADIATVADARALDEFRVRYLARKGAMAALFEQLKSAPADQKPALGKLLNELRAAIQQLHDAKAASLGKSVV